MSLCLKSLYENHVSELDRFVGRRVDPQMALDVVHDGYLRLMSQPDQARIENPRAYLYRITANLTNDLHSQKRHKESALDEELPSHSASPETIAVAKDTLQHCISALYELPEIYRHVFLLHRIEGLSQTDISQALQIPKRTVERYIAKALAHCLKSLL